MRKLLHLLVFVLALALAYASAQSSGSSPSTSNQSTTSQPSQDQNQKPEAQSGSSATATSSNDIQSQIQDALKKDPTLSSANITVSVTDDAVELNGTVASNDEKKAAKKIAKSYAGNRKVKDNLTVSGGGSKATPPGAMGFVSAGAYSQSQSSQQQPQSTQPSGSQSGTAQSPSTSQSPSGEPPSTQTAPNPNGSMNQTPNSPEQTPSSQQAPGATAAAGGDIQMQIQNALQKEPTLSNDNITVSVTDDTIELNGTVASGKEKQTAKRIAQSYAGNRKVKEHLTVSGQGASDNKSPDHNMTTPPNNPSAPDPNSPSAPSSPARPPRK
ncbi:MAG TPA: BON domain-containing protein [Candidatus Angelobacter sp.]|nr:BON domain-containing protein [Candidatus Angelobacter sp.]